MKTLLCLLALLFCSALVAAPAPLPRKQKPITCFGAWECNLYIMVFFKDGTWNEYEKNYENRGMVLRWTGKWVKTANEKAVMIHFKTVDPNTGVVNDHTSQAEAIFDSKAIAVKQWNLKYIKRSD